jgi:hypothetical protein
MNCTPEVIDALPDIVRWLFTLRGNFAVFHTRSCCVMSDLSSLHSFLVTGFLFHRFDLRAVERR